MANAGLGIRRIEAIHTYVRDLERSRHFYTRKLDFAEVAVSGSALIARGRQRSVILEAGECRVVCSCPVGTGGRADRYLHKHPDGIGSIVFEVGDIAHTFATLEARGGTPIDDVVVTAGAHGLFKTFVIATPFGDTTFRFVERVGDFPLYPGFDIHPTPQGGTNAFGFSSFDHVTSNFETLSPALLWLEHVMGFERFWQVEFHTNDVTGPRPSGEAQGSGLRSVVMWDPGSGIKLANNEPQRPSFKSSQINLFHEDNRGDGIQHVALHVNSITDAIRGLRRRGVEFMPTPAAYYRALPERLRKIGIEDILGESLGELEELEILVDGDGQGRYLLQIFLKDSAGTHGTPEAGPFFFEIIQRRGDDGFGAGNFRALFESIEREQSEQREESEQRELPVSGSLPPQQVPQHAHPAPSTEPARGPRLVQPSGDS
jgi:4-hydroxyphenylpyruvate dioxygenase